MVAQPVRIRQAFAKVRQAIYFWLIFVTQRATKSARCTDNRIDWLRTIGSECSTLASKAAYP